MLSGASGTVLAGFTGTPILNKVHGAAVILHVSTRQNDFVKHLELQHVCRPSQAMEGRQPLDIIKGASAPRGDGGFLSSFPMRPVS